jgi:hypothetical protein
MGGAFQLAVWIFALIQAAIAVQAIVLPLHDTWADAPLILPPDAAEASGEDPTIQFAVLRSGPPPQHLHWRERARQRPEPRWTDR